LLHRFHQPVSIHEFVENFLEDVFGVAIVRDALADELAQPSLFPGNRFGDSPILVGDDPVSTQHFLHPHPCRRTSG